MASGKVIGSNPLSSTKASFTLAFFNHVLCYIIFSSKTNKFYIGSADNLNSRLKHHKSGATPSTKSGAPLWEIRYVETLPDRTTALKRELEIKKKKANATSSG
ncbi:MAG: hypothetical protein B7Z16_13010 [Algoriphagus sp. 32-45-6]|nr:MAG: hypothetical protein B7Z16_13010 [Algoriphagus sp. 32-45-6]